MDPECSIRDSRKDLNRELTPYFDVRILSNVIPTA